MIVTILKQIHLNKYRHQIYFSLSPIFFCQSHQKYVSRKADLKHKKHRHFCLNVFGHFNVFRVDLFCHSMLTFFGRRGPDDVPVRRRRFSVDVLSGPREWKSVRLVRFADPAAAACAHLKKNIFFKSFYFLKIWVFVSDCVFDKIL